MLQAGFARFDITPPLGTYMAGYYHERQADGILDPLLATCVAFRDAEGSTALVFSVDNLMIKQIVADVLRATVAKMTGVSEEAIFLACTHIHTGPIMAPGQGKFNPVYNEWLGKALGTAGCEAMADLAPAELLGAEGRAEGIAFVRRFRMKDGSIKTNPGYLNPNVKEPIGTPDETLNSVYVLVFSLTLGYRFAHEYL